MELNDVSGYLQQPADAKVSGLQATLQTLQTRTSQQAVQENNDPVEHLPSPTTAVAHKPERWNTPRTNLWRTLAAFWSFVVMGSNDAAYGVSDNSEYTTKSSTDMD